MLSRWNIQREEGELVAYTFTLPELALVHHASGWWIECDGEPVLWWLPSFDHWFFKRFK